MNPRAAPTAFTLLEVLAALVILSLLAAAATLSFNKPLARARAFDALEQIRQLDASARQFSRTFGKPALIIFDLADQSISRREPGSREAVFTTTLPSPLRIEQIRTAARRVDYGEVAISCSPAGLSETYAIKMVGAPDSPISSDNKSIDTTRWIVVAGLSGEIRTVRDERDVDFILAGASPIVQVAR